MYPSPQVIENLILVVAGLGGFLMLRRLVRAAETISVALRLSLKPIDPSRGPLTVSESEIKNIQDPTVDGRYARFTFPASMRPFKD